MNHTISKEFHFFSLLKFALPTIVMMVFMSLYTIVDGIFVSRFVGTDALSAINIVFPVINIVIAIAIMLATGGSAIIARRMGEHNIETARENLTLITLAGVVGGAVIGILGMIFIEPLIRMLGAQGDLIPFCRDYLRIMLFFAPAGVLQILFQTFLVTEGKPNIGLALTVIAGVVNAVFDYIFIVPMNMGIAGAALATSMGYLIPAIYGVAYFLRKRKSLYFARPKLDWKVILDSCSNGSSEMVTNVSSGVITFLFNIIMMKFLGEDGVAAITIILYAQFLLTALYMGFSMGVAPVISYNYGSGNTNQLKRIFKICMIFIGVSSVVVFATSNLLAGKMVAIFSPVGTTVYDIAINGFILFSISYLFAGINIFASAMFTALSNGKISAFISFMRTFVFIVAGVLVLPLFLNVDGIWLAVPLAELLTVAISLWYLFKGRKIYDYA